MNSWSKKIYLSLLLSLVFVTAIAVKWLPDYLDESEGSGIKALEAAPKVAFSGEHVGRTVTRFPTRPFLEDTEKAAPRQNPPAEESPLPGGLPGRVVPGVHSAEPIGERVTTRAYLRANSSVYAKAQTTATALGRVGSQTKVRWLASAGEGWEEILLKDGRSAFVQSQDLSFQADDPSTVRESSPGRQSRASDQPDASTLPGTVEIFLQTLSSSDLLRAETYLAPSAPGLNQDSLSGLTPYVGAPPYGRVLRLELVAGEATARKARLVYGESMEHEVSTFWEWDRAQQRWMLVRWD